MRSKLRMNRPWRFCLIGVGLSVVAGICLSRPVLVRYQVRQARLALDDRDPERALDWLGRADRVDPDRAEVPFWMARAYRRLGQVDQVRIHLERARRLGYPAKALEREEVLMWAQAGRLPPGDRRLTALMLDPGDDGREIYEAIVQGYLEAFHLGPAVTLLEGWRNDYPGDPQPHVYLGVTWSHQQAWADAIASFRKALQLAPQRYDVRLHLAGALREDFRYREALSHYDRCIEEEERPEALFGRATCLKALRKEEEAREAFLRLLANAPEHYEGRLALGQLAFSMGDAAEAVEWLEPAVKQRPHEFEGRHALAWALLVVGQKERAREHFEAAAKIQEASQRAANLERHAEIEPENAEMRYELGTILIEHGQFSAGLAWLQSVLQLQPGHRLTHRALADYYRQQGATGKAAEHRRLADRSE